MALQPLVPLASSKYFTKVLRKNGVLALFKFLYQNNYLPYQNLIHHINVDAFLCIEFKLSFSFIGDCFFNAVPQKIDILNLQIQIQFNLNLLQY